MKVKVVVMYLCVVILTAVVVPFPLWTTFVRIPSYQAAQAEKKAAKEKDRESQQLAKASSEQLHFVKGGSMPDPFEQIFGEGSGPLNALVANYGTRDHKVLLAEKESRQ